MGKATVIPFGPQHPVLPEPLHLDLVVEDETVIEAVPQIGFIHRGLEKLVETRDYNQFIYVAERICGICAFGHSLGYAETVERLMGVEVPRARRVPARHLARTVARPLPYPVDGLGRRRVRFRKPVHALLAVARARARHLREDHRRPGDLQRREGGRVVRDIDEAQLAEIKRVLEGIKDDYRQIMNAFLKDTSVKNRTVGVGVISHEDALALSMVGPFARASNVNYDVRMLGNGGYGRLSDFQPVLDAQGDCYARVKVRALEVLQSIDIIEEMIAQLPPETSRRTSKGLPPRARRRRTSSSQPRGECYYYARGNGTKYLERMRMRTPTSQTWRA